jgi:hypothetical protein
MYGASKSQSLTYNSLNKGRYGVYLFMILIFVLNWLCMLACGAIYFFK